jgi:hypothetical protein
MSENKPIKLDMLASLQQQKTQATAPKVKIIHLIQERS